MKNQVIHLIIALFLTSSLAIANNGTPTIKETVTTATNTSFIALNKLSFIKIQGQTVSLSDNTVRCKIVSKPNTCVTIRMNENRRGVLMIHNKLGSPFMRFMIQGFDFEDGYINGFNFIDVNFEVIPYLEAQEVYQSSPSHN